MVDPIEIDEVLESSNFGDKFVDAEYVLEDCTQVEAKVENNDRDSDSELETGDLESGEDALHATE